LNLSFCHDQRQVLDELVEWVLSLLKLDPLPRDVASFLFHKTNDMATTLPFYSCSWDRQGAFFFLDWTMCFAIARLALFG
jgi:hypothetical protein